MQARNGLLAQHYMHELAYGMLASLLQVCAATVKVPDCNDHLLPCTAPSPLLHVQPSTGRCMGQVDSRSVAENVQHPGSSARTKLACI